MKFLRHTTLAAACAVVLTSQTDMAIGQSRICVDLEARLIALERGGAQRSVNERRDYDSSIRQQQLEIDRATAEARRVGCIRGFLVFQRQAAPKCGQLMATIERMKTNLRRLNEARSRIAGGSVSRQRNELLRSMQANRCNVGQARARSAQQRGTGLFASLFGQARTRELGDDMFFRGTGLGTYRTLCVRTCDGYYFPISFSTVPGQFGTDQQTCQAMCPGTDVRLYTHRNPGEESDAMVSLNGEPYSALPTAFRYREEYVPSCGCGSTTDPLVTASLTQGFDTGNARPQRPLVPIPVLRPAARSEDPETLANRNGGFAVVQKTGGEETEMADLPDGQKVRIVGPSFYYGQQTEVGMLVPVKKPSLRSDAAEEVSEEGAEGTQ